MLTRHARPFLTTISLALGLLFLSTSATTAALPPQPYPCPELPGFPPPYWCPFIIGIDGGGTVQTEFGDAHFALFTTNLHSRADEENKLTIGQIQWVDPNAGSGGLTLTATQIDVYGPLSGVEGGRVIRGLMTVNGEAELPFVLFAVDGGPPSAGADTLELSVGNQVQGAATGSFGYHAKGPLTAGDLQLLNFQPEPQEDTGY